MRKSENEDTGGWGSAMRLPEVKKTKRRYTPEEYDHVVMLFEQGKA